jgi:hypothetical protein
LFNQIDNYMDSFDLSCSNQDTGNSAAFPAQTLNRLDYKKGGLPCPTSWSSSCFEILFGMYPCLRHV